MQAPIIALLVVAALATTSVTAQKEVCEKLSQCLVEVKAKESSCQQTTLAPSTPANAAKAECVEAVKSKGDALKALTQRKAEAYGTCINSKAESAVAITNAKKKEKCEALLARRSRARRQGEEEDEELKPKKTGGRGGGRRGRPKGSEQTDPSCQAELRQMRTRCAKLSKCCSVTKECREGESSLNQEIKAARVALRTQNQQCRGAKGRGNKGTGRRGGQKGRGGKATTTLAPETKN